MLERILAEIGNGALLEALAERLSSTDLLSLLLEVFARRSAELDATSLARRFPR